MAMLQNSTTGSTDDNDPEPLQQTAYPHFQNLHQYNNSKWSTKDMTNGVNNENVVSQLLRLSLDCNNDNNNRAVPIQLTRKWSHEEPPKLTGMTQSSIYAAYMPAANDCHFIPATTGKWSTAQEPQMSLPVYAQKSNNSTRPHKQVYPQHIPSTRQERQIFAQLNPTLSPNRHQIPTMGCSEAEIQQWNQQIDSQQRAYVQLYQRFINAELTNVSSLDNTHYQSIQL